MEWVETTGKTISEAKEAALDELGVDEQDAEFEVLAEPKVGLFGRLRTEGRVRARVRPTTPRAKEDRRDRRRRTRATAATDGPDDAATSSSEAPSNTTEAEESATRGGRRGAAKSPPAQVTSAARPSPSMVEGEAVSNLTPGGSRPARSRSRRRGGRGGGQAPTEAGPANLDGDADPTPRPRRPAPDQEATTTRPNRVDHRDDRAVTEGVEMDVALEEQGEVATAFLSGLVERFGLDAAIDVRQPDDDTLNIALTGDDLGLLIGPKGATLLSIQDLTRTVVQRQTGAGNGRIYVDVSGYRQKRGEALGRFTTKVAADVVASQERIALEPMSAPDRKVVHDTATGIPGVTTLSEGEEPRRRVVIIPTED